MSTSSSSSPQPRSEPLPPPPPPAVVNKNPPFPLPPLILGSCEKALLNDYSPPSPPLLPLAIALLVWSDGVGVSLVWLPYEGLDRAEPTDIDEALGDEHRIAAAGQPTQRSTHRCTSRPIGIGIARGAVSGELDAEHECDDAQVHRHESES
jgi:hypothetical protein